MNRQPVLLYPNGTSTFYGWLRVRSFVLACSIALIISATIIVTFATPAQAQSRSHHVRRDRRPTREINIRYPSSSNNQGGDNRGGYVQRDGQVPVFRPGPSSPITSPDLSDESNHLNDTPNAHAPR